MIALLKAELLKLRTTRTFAAVVGTAAALSLILVALGTILGKETDPEALFTNDSITYIIVLLGAIGMTGEWRHRTITGSVLAAPNRLRLLIAKALAYGLAGVVLTLLVTVATMAVGTAILDARGDATLGAGGLADVLWRNLAVAAVLGPLGVCVGALVRNQIVTVVGLVALAAMLEPAIAQVAPDVGRFGPLAGAPGGILGGPDAAAGGLLAPGLAAAVLIGWAGLAFAAAAWRLQRRDLV
ncbi:ABC transporter permease [Solirubrobacter soli]|uniref:ABC transporter permease n=1 Tax=Solirubrobacter soli TaxID=363832 RepID=UPI0004123858|nr:ABC transporter permease [Solirubrobacter soli]